MTYRMIHGYGQKKYPSPEKIAMDSKRLMTAAVFFLFFTNSTLALAVDQAQNDSTEKEGKAFDAMFSKGPQEEDVYRTDRLLLTATGSQIPVHKAPAVASVITAADIEAMGATTLEEALETVPGLHVGASFGLMAPIYSIRGIQTGLNPQVLVLINGLPITYLYNGRRAFGLQIPTTNISRIEVVRGPGSAVYGADAFAGTINVFTKDGLEIDGTTVGARAGSFDTYDTWLQHGATYGGWNMAINLEYRESRGDSDRIAKADQQTIFDQLFNDIPPLPHASLAPGTLATQYQTIDANLDLRRDNWTIRLYGFLLDDGGVGPSGTQVVDPAGECETQLLLGDVTYQIKKDRDWDVSTRLSYLYQHEDTYFRMFPPGALIPIQADGNIGAAPLAGFALYTEGLIGDPILTDQQTAMDFTAFYRGFDQHVLRFGTGFRVQQEDTDVYQNFGYGVLDPTTLFPGGPGGPVAPVNGSLTHITGDSPYTFLPNNNRTIWYGSAQDEWSFAHSWELVGGIRYDHYSDFGSTINPRLALIWETRYDLTSKLLYGRAFRAPSFAEEYNKNNPSALGNPNVKPETIDTLELAFDYQPTSRFRTIFNIFGYDIKDLIDYVSDPGATSKTAQNAMDQRGYGFELEAKWDVTDTFQLRANLAHQRSKDRDTDAIVPDTPAWQYYTNAHWLFLPDWSVDGQFFWIGDRVRADGDPRPDIDNYTKVDFTLRRKNIAKHWDAALAVRNLFDTDIREPSDGVIPGDYPMPGRNIFGELRYRF